VKTNEIVSGDGRPLETDDLFAIANLFPHTTGLPMTVWVSPRGNGRRAAQVKVNVVHGNQTDGTNTAVVGIRPSPHIIAGRLSSDDRQAVFRWVSLNSFY
jgi:hypothetical protein